MILRLQGGLGNQLFQLLALRYLATIEREEKFVYIQDLAFFKAKRQFEIRFLLSDENILNQISMLDRLLFRTKVSKVLAQIGIHSISTVKQIDSWKSQILNGYFQDIYNYPDYSLVKLLITEIQEKMTVKRDENNFFNNACAIHLRLTDFVQTPQQREFLLNYRIPYILRAIEWYKSMEVNKFILFTDDIYTAKEFFDDKNVIPYSEFDNSQDLIEEFASLCSFPNLICSNSTFSFWASMLGVPKKVAFPLIWDSLNKTDEKNFQANLAVYDKISIFSNQLIRL